VKCPASTETGKAPRRASVDDNLDELCRRT
jgi:hypothetical protein